MIELNDDTDVLLQKVKKEFGQSLSDEEVIRDALQCYYTDIVQINRQKSKYADKKVNMHWKLKVIDANKMLIMDKADNIMDKEGEK